MQTIQDERVMRLKYACEACAYHSLMLLQVSEATLDNGLQTDERCVKFSKQLLQLAEWIREETATQ